MRGSEVGHRKSEVGERLDRADAPNDGPATSEYPPHPLALPDTVIDGGSYQVRFARTAEDLDRILRLRFQIFNLELGEGLDEAYRTGKDEDLLDAQFHHLMIVSRATGDVVGTYRMQTSEMADQGPGFYSDGEFDLEPLPADVRRSAVEIGRACVAKDHRNGRVLQLLWRGLATYLAWNRKQVLFGCCSLTTQDPAVGLSVQRHLDENGHLHPEVAVGVLPQCRCDLVPGTELPPPHVPALFQAYLSLGAKVISAPAIDRDFKTIDWLVMLDVRTIDPTTYRFFFRDLSEL
ncbi:MAG: GNAT family N-acyltransferase [Gemmatimonadota bacterium]